MNKQIEGMGNSAYPGFPQEVIVREIYIKETEYKVLNSVRPPPPEIVYLRHEEPDTVGFWGFVGVILLLVMVAVGISMFNQAFAQSNIKDFYGHGDYGAYRNIPSPQVYVVPVPIQPQIRESPQSWKCQIEEGYSVCYRDGRLDTRCKGEGANRTCTHVGGRPIGDYQGITVRVK